MGKQRWAPHREAVILVPPGLQDILDSLAMFPDRADRIQLLIGFAEKFSPVPPCIATRPFAESHRVPGCESEAFAWSILDETGHLHHYFAVENPQGVSAMAMAVILQDGHKGATPIQIADVPEDVVYTIFGRELSMGKSMGLMGLVQMVKAQAKLLVP